MKCRCCKQDMQLDAQCGEDIDYYKFERWDCPDCKVCCEVDIEGETPMLKQWYTYGGEKFYEEAQ